MTDSLLLRLAGIAEMEFADVTTGYEIKQGKITPSTAGTMRSMKYGRMSGRFHTIFIIAQMMMYVRVFCRAIRIRRLDSFWDLSETLFTGIDGGKAWNKSLNIPD
jgi:hypothetical protein